ncbi:MAG TPA: tRNA dihydrouridine synthase DusB [Anaerolineae bacterium]|nr:tRNA dihydrouridine synthase DusB [Anaerolineae bacterium]
MNAPRQPNFTIRDIPIYGDVILSPMAGFSDLPFRSICRAYGSAMSYTEFVSAEAMSHNNPKTWRFFDFKPEERPVTFQFFDNDVERLVTQIKRAVDRCQPDIVDINMGCSVSSVSQRGAGAGLLRTPAKIAQIFDRLTHELTIPITGKIRLGWDDDALNYLEVAHVLEDNGASAIAVHGRTKAQAYKGEARWTPIGEVKAAVKIPVIGNGDVKRAADIDRLKQQTGCDAVMIGRAAIGNPWIFQRKDRSDVSFTEKAQLIRRHLAAMMDYYGAASGLIFFRKHVVKYIKGAQGVSDLHLPLVTCTTADQFIELFGQLEEKNRPQVELEGSW